MTLLFHHHIYKSAGTTVDWILERNFPGRVLHVDDGNPGDRFLPAPLARLALSHSSYTCYSSHKAPLPGPGEAWCKIHFTLLRDPLQRFYSMYRFARSHPSATDEDASVAERRTFAEYCRWWMAVSGGRFMNWQTRCCTAQSELTLREEAGWHLDLDSATTCLQDVALAGTVQQFDQTMVLLEDGVAEYGVDFDAAYVRQNVGPRVATDRRKNMAELLGESLLREFTEANALDHQLHERARRLVSDRFSRLPRHRDRLDDFRARCRRLQD